jgi:valyl-tRNA synthetase
MDVSPLITNACKDEDVALLLLLPMMPFIGDKLSHSFPKKQKNYKCKHFPGGETTNNNGSMSLC